MAVINARTPAIPNSQPPTTPASNLRDLDSPPDDTGTRKLFRTIILRQLHADQHRLPQTWLQAAAETITTAQHQSHKRRPGPPALAHHVLPNLMTRQHNT
jgi:hypothetical protein